MNLSALKAEIARLREERSKEEATLAVELPRSSFTCYTCVEQRVCAFAFDLYNTHGDCLAEK